MSLPPTGGSFRVYYPPQQGAQNYGNWPPNGPSVEFRGDVWQFEFDGPALHIWQKGRDTALPQLWLAPGQWSHVEAF